MLDFFKRDQDHRKYVSAGFHHFGLKVKSLTGFLIQALNRFPHSAIQPRPNPLKIATDRTSIMPGIEEGPYKEMLKKVAMNHLRYIWQMEETINRITLSDDGTVQKFFQSLLPDRPQSSFLEVISHEGPSGKQIPFNKVASDQLAKTL